MGSATKIEWCDHTFNPWRGCAKVSPGCAKCYAEQLSARNPKVLGEWGPKGTRAMASEPYWRQPCVWDRVAMRTNERRRVFCASLADVFEDRPDLLAHRARLWQLIFDTPRLDWLIVTKRPENFARMLPWDASDPWANVWLGVSVEDQQRADERIPLLLQTPAAVRFLSCEPLLGPLDLSGVLSRLDWLIVGGESGPKARPCDVEWIRSIVCQCRGAGVPVFVKQVGSKPTVPHPSHPGDPHYRQDFPLSVTDRKGGDPSEWPDDLRVREFPERRKK